MSPAGAVVSGATVMSGVGTVVAKGAAVEEVVAASSPQAANRMTVSAISGMRRLIVGTPRWGLLSLRRPQTCTFRPLNDTTQLQIEISEVPGHPSGAVLRFVGEVDIATADTLAAAFEDLEARQLTEVIVDASMVTFMDSTGLHALVSGKDRIHGSGTTIALIASPQVRRVLELIFPEPLFAARVDTMDQARESLGWLASNDR